MNKEEVKRILDTMPKDENIKPFDADLYMAIYDHVKGFLKRHPDERMQEYYERRASIYFYI